MQEFEKWYRKNKGSGQEYAFAEPWEIAGAAWKAALGMLYGKLGHSQEHEQIKDMIEEELE